MNRNIAKPCERNRSAFDADFLDPSDFRQAKKRGQSTERHAALLQDAVEDTVKAIQACQSCPILALCRNELKKSIAEGAAPAGVVQCGIFWGYDHKPDFTLNGCVNNKSAEAAKKRSGDLDQVAYRIDDNGQRWPMTVPVYVERGRNARACTKTKGGPIKIDLGTWDLAWIPPIPESINRAAVALAVEKIQSGENIIITRAKLQRTDVDADGREVLSDADVCEVMRELHTKGTSVRLIATRLGLSHATTKKVLLRLGIPVENSKIHQEAAQRREERRRQVREQFIREMEQAKLKRYRMWDDTEAGEQIPLIMDSIHMC
ncbi:hypothetical protein [Corynebacterium crudilactis]|uniref:Uncharacterized protein n=1 Tax=Corynebacterium crudilactis TaxID=1652495 RepID=A0A172QXV0_9CORY|nr:hypothetical protein [Corynebacterium crudilactis]ANE05471.1 hypothetical protein ccrud_14110 [Corynebacterium crudilactis]